MKKQFYLAKIAVFLAVMASIATKANAACTMGTTMTPGAVTCSTAVFSWPAVSGVMFYEYVLDNSMTDPIGAGTMLMTDTATVTGLTASKTYYAHVRVMCMSGYSAWSTLGTIATPACVTCAAPASMTTTAGPHNVSVTWPAVTGAMGYEYVVNTTMTDPAGAGTAATTNTVNATGLTASTPYYVHTRTKCGSSTYSPWSAAKSFSTSVSTGINMVNSDDFFLRTYPNPVANSLTVEVNGGELSSATLQIMEVDGRIIKNVSLLDNATSVELSNLHSGIYIVKYADNRHSQTVKIIKE
ncbi:MAG: Fibronectin type domain protein [Flavipsychrobacter sp.]|nr:Fibronectin type domain protein [Flavipsychrobacter sp.]